MIYLFISSVLKYGNGAYIDAIKPKAVWDKITSHTL